ncbi:hypothetical protein [Enterovibrio paralichthyis]|uniref:hypothetical protein n=1 Tax=Enterovibrio paralichthyis TaxID=2853805 RepID=UPI001C4743A3|nr:hypothetical protein [Enterovibrio paralichthyis]MBV7300192.1 hypothetical protein [Enterovibrio paralichthyis]
MSSLESISKMCEQLYLMQRLEWIRLLKELKFENSDVPIVIKFIERIEESVATNREVVVDNNDRRKLRNAFFNVKNRWNGNMVEVLEYSMGDVLDLDYHD